MAVKRAEGTGAELFVRTTSVIFCLSPAGERYLPSQRNKRCRNVGSVFKSTGREELASMMAKRNAPSRARAKPSYLARWSHLITPSDTRTSISDSNIDLTRFCGAALRYGSPTDVCTLQNLWCVPRILCASTWVSRRRAPRPISKWFGRHNADRVYQLHDALQDEWVFNDGTQDQ